MTPKEKAEELVNEMIKTQGEIFCSWKQAKQCALIAVDEIINTESLKNRNCGYVYLNTTHLEFWQEVKQEIEKI